MYTYTLAATSKYTSATTIMLQYCTHWHSSQALGLALKPGPYQHDSRCFQILHPVKRVLSTPVYCSACSWSFGPALVSIVWCAKTLVTILPIQQKNSSCYYTPHVCAMKVMKTRSSAVMLFGHCSRQATHKGMLALSLALKIICSLICNTTVKLQHHKSGSVHNLVCWLTHIKHCLLHTKPCTGTSLTQRLMSTKVNTKWIKLKTCSQVGNSLPVSITYICYSS